MIPLAFYAPLKAPDHPTPSGDREIARALCAALQTSSYAPDVVSDFRSLDTRGNGDAQDALLSEAQKLIPELIATGRNTGWRAWVTYHNYYKAPDLLGPDVSRALNIPYVQIESTRARKRLSGPWAQFAKAAERAADAAQAILYFTERDGEALHDYAPKGQSLHLLKPFLNRDMLPNPSTRQGPMLSVGMMREGDKLASYKLIADTLALLDGDWQLDIIGDGPARGDVEILMQPFGSRVRFLGQRDQIGMKEAYSTASLLIWPGVNEAIGLVYLEAQAAGIPVLAQDRPGLREVIAPALPLADPDIGAEGLATTARQLMRNSPPAETLQAHIKANHLRPAAASTLHGVLSQLIEAAP